MALKVHAISMKATGHVLAACTLEEGRSRASLLSQVVGKEFTLFGATEDDTFEDLVSLAQERLQVDAVPDDPFVSKVVSAPTTFALKRSLTSPDDVSLLVLGPVELSNDKKKIEFETPKARRIVTFVSDETVFEGDFDGEAYTLPDVATGAILAVFVEGFAPYVKKG